MYFGELCIELVSVDLWIELRICTSLDKSKKNQQSTIFFNTAGIKIFALVTKYQLHHVTDY